MATQSRLFSLLASKLGLHSDIVIKKGHEFYRLLQLKTSTCAGNISEPCQIVICLDLAASVIGMPFEKHDAIRLAGVTKKNYTSFQHTIEKLLGVGKCVSIKDLCVQFGVNEASSLAQKILDKYVSENAHGTVVDLSHPMYNVAAVIAACKHCRLKVDRAKLLEMSHIQKSSFLKLAHAFEKYAEQLNPNPKLSSCGDEEEDKYKPANARKMTRIVTKGTQEYPPLPSRHTPDTCYLQSYEDWKRSIIEECDNGEA